MYSVMLAAMLTTTSATPEWGCHGCYGCHGGYSFAYCHGCCGGCYGYYSYNAFSCGCSGCSCRGCWGCYGCSCWGSYGCSCWGCSCSGSCWGSYGCYGCSCGGYSLCSCGGGSYGCSCSGGATSTTQGASGSSASGGTARERALEEEVRRLRDEVRQMREGGKPPIPKPRKPDEVSAPAPAHLVVKLPEQARLFIDDTACPLTSATRSFDTPDLQPGQVYSYTLRAELTVAGRPVSESKRVTFRAGEETVVEFTDLQLVQAAR